MTKGHNPATTRSTAGSGFAFEDFVAADLLSWFLLNMPIHGISVPGRKLFSQTQAIGWKVDDLLCVGIDANGREYKLALSCKSNVQVTGHGLPADFVSAAWDMWRAEAPFCRDTDRIALVTRGRHVAFDALWHDIKSWCTDGNPTLAFARIDASARHRRVFNSIRTPGTQHGVIPELAETIALIGRLEVHPVDFQLNPSNSMAHAHYRCRMALLSESDTEAKNLWESLVQRAMEARLGNGAIELSELLQLLGGRFALKAHPSISATWSRLMLFTSDHRAGIETALPGGNCLARPSEHLQLSTALASKPGCIVLGDSGVGKSALVKLVLDQDFADTTQIWLGPETLASALSDAERSAMGLDCPLTETFIRSPGNKKILVLDSAERLDSSSLSRLEKLIRELVTQTDDDRPWRIVFIAQTIGFEAQSQPLAITTFWPKVMVQALSNASVQSALANVTPLRWIANDDEILPLLANLRTLGWVIASASSFVEGISGELTSTATIADRLWLRWTGGRAQLQRLMIRLAEREASFERSFAISELDGADASAFDTRSNQVPLIVNARNRIEFQHDLASDWARYQRLKEIADDIPRWALLAPQPLWISSLRLFGQHLLTERDQARHGWDHAFATLTALKHVEATDLLLDALCLDSRLDTHLEARAELFFAQRGALILRLFHRFLHLATNPCVPATFPVSPDLRIYLEADMRMPILGRWIPMARFLSRNVERVSALSAPIVSKICALWLNTTPRIIGETAMPFRDVMARLALETARTDQIESIAHRIVGAHGNDAKHIYSSALAGAADLPEDVAIFALEMAQRRPLVEASQTRVNTLRLTERVRLDAAKKNSPQRPRSIPTSLIFSKIKLPPWPEGPSERINGAFRAAVLHGNALSTLMQVAPAAASEVLLACIIKVPQTKEFGSSMYFEDDLGMEFDLDSTPTIFWKSPFLLYLQIQPDAALAALRQLIDFATQRWAARAPVGAHIPSLSVSLAGGKKQEFRGNHVQFGWSQQNSTSSGQLFSALDALERWLTLKIDAGEDIAPWCQRILDMGTSTALLGVLVNLGKYQPTLFQSVLVPLTEIEALYRWDDSRVESVNFNFAAFNWSRQGETVFNMARNWVLAPHRRKTFRSVLSNLVVADTDLAKRVTDASALWPQPVDPKALIEQQILRVELDPIYRQLIVDETNGEAVSRIVYPIELQQAITAFQKTAAINLEPFTVPYKCEEILAGETPLSNADAAYLANLLPEVGSTLPESHDQRRMMAAASATLMARGIDWLQGQGDVTAKTLHVIHTLITETGSTLDKIEEQNNHSSYGTLRFAAIGALYAAINTKDSGSWDQVLVSVISGRDQSAIGGLMREAARNRVLLGPVWYQLMRLLILAAGLDRLAPDWEDAPAVTVRWNRWLTRLRYQPVFGTNADLTSFNPINIARRVERLLVIRSTRLRPDICEHVGTQGRKRQFTGLNWQILNVGFNWLIDHELVEVNVLVPENHSLIGHLWRFEEWRMVGERDEMEVDVEDFEGGEYDLPSELGYSILRIAPTFILAPLIGEAAPIWRQILGLGPDGHYAINNFIGSWFLTLLREHDPNRFIVEWRAMLDYAVAANWCSGRRWYRGREMYVNLLGFNASRELTHGSVICERLPELLPYYRRWAEEQLSGDEDNIAIFSHFLTTQPGESLRLEGLIWLNSALLQTKRLNRISTGNSIAEAIDTILMQHPNDLISQPASREAMIAIVARLVREQIGAAMGLQKRIGNLR
ncbi:hypothetical protein AF70_00032420 [Pseudomonas sp. KD5]|nr:ATP-binding protein [Pseudomonas umsongensis]NMN77678.1 hypothetical protein [Pseudomonas sp. KD5]